MDGSSTARAKEGVRIPAPRTSGETGISKSLLDQLALKILALGGEMSLLDLAERMCLRLSIVEDIFQSLRREQLCEVKGMELGTYRIAPSAQGKVRAMDLLAANSYSGPAPVSLAGYTAQVREQSAQKTVARAADLVRAFGPLVLSAEMFLRLGTALVSGTSLFLYGPSGTGKTSIANSIAAIYEDAVWIPHAIEVDGQIITVYDASVHRQIDAAVPEDADHRWVPCRRPKVMAGGELSSDELELQFNSVSRFYTAPLQMKANNGVLVLDDFGRQRIPPNVLLNRWMTPLDCGYDFLTLTGGKKLEVPFDLFIVFATNLDPADLADEAFLRRIPNKIKADYATPEQFTEILRIECAARSLSLDPAMAQHLVQYIQEEMKRPLAQCYARDVLNQILWNAAYLGVEAKITTTALEVACRNYFLATADSAANSSAKSTAPPREEPPNTR
jgi:MoxR-like ATPase